MNHIENRIFSATGDRADVVRHLYTGGPHTPETRSSNLIRFFGWQGGTIHQVAEETGVDVQTLLYADVPAIRSGLNYDHFSQGALCSETCDLAYRMDVAKRRKGNPSFWLGVAQSRPID